MSDSDPSPRSRPPTTEAVAPPRASGMPIPWVWIVVSGAAYGALMRLVFGFWPFTRVLDGSGAMLVSFLFLVPLLIGVVTVARVPPVRRSWGFAIAGPWMPVLIFVATTALLAIEGSICIALSLPIFLVMSSLGGIAAHLVFGVVPARSTTRALLALPLAAGLVEAALPPADEIARSEASIHIAAPPARIWNLINDAQGIVPEEMNGWAWRIGVPSPVSAVTVEENGTRVRKLRWRHGVHFDEPILDWQPDRYIRWSYRFAPDSIPSGALDEHVRIGGRHFDLLDTSYRLDPEGDGTRLSIVVDYRIGTRFNPYAVPLGRFLVDDAAKTILEFYRRRSETVARADGNA